MSALMTHSGPSHVGVLVRPRPQRILPSNYGGNRNNNGEDHEVKDKPDMMMSPWPPSQELPVQSSLPLQSPVPVKPVLVEPDPEETIVPLNPRPQQQVTTQLVRPIALKVARPIPKSAVEQFYEESYRQGLQAEHVHEATVLAHEWHRKWTQQDEEGHTMPEPEAEQGPLSRPAPERVPAPYDPFERYSGAKNPSPEESREDPYSERKRLRITASGSISSLSPDSGEGAHNREQSSLTEIRTGYEPPVSRRRMIGLNGPAALVREDSNDPSQTSPIPNFGMIKPVALRVHRPEAVDITTALDILAQTQNYIQDLVPSDIKDFRSQHSALSPLTLPSVSSSYMKARPAIIEGDEDSSHAKCIPSEISHVSKRRRARTRSPQVVAARSGVLHRLAVTGGDVVDDAEFLEHLEILTHYFESTGVDTRYETDNQTTVEGKWLTLTKPTYFGNLGNNDDGDPMYTLGRMSFDMFSPTRLVCSLQGNFNCIESVSDDRREGMLNAVPKALQEEVQSGEVSLRTYDIVTALTIEPHLAAWPNAPNKDVRRPIKGIMTTAGYILPDPENPNRNSVWITGGRIEPNDDPIDQQEWKRQFGKNPPKHGFGEHAKLLAVKLLMGATIPDHMAADGIMEYTFQRPFGGHGLAYIDTLYVDESLRIVKGHRGTIFVFFKPEGNHKTQ